MKHKINTEMCKFWQLLWLKNIFYVNTGDIDTKNDQIANLFFEKNPKNSQLEKFRP